MGGDITYCAAVLKSGSHIFDSSIVSAEVTVSPITRTPAARTRLRPECTRAAHRLHPSGRPNAPERLTQRT
eukprot:3111574-Pyramimonas_sp.AAC.1